MGVHVVMNQKGGVGKSTLAMNLAAVKADVLVDPAGEQGVSPVLAVSIDPHGSAVWWADRVADLPSRIAQAHDDVGMLGRLGPLPGIEYVIVDTPGWIGDTPVATENGGTGYALDTVL